MRRGKVGQEYSGFNESEFSEIGFSVDQNEPNFRNQSQILILG